MDIKELIKKIGESTNYNYSDLIIKEGEENIGIKINGKLKFILIQQKIENSHLRSFINTFGEGLYDRFTKNKSIDLGSKIENIKFRINISYSKGRILMVIRKLNNTIIPIDNLGIDKKFIEKILGAEKGLILVSGKTGSGKSTTLASIVDYYNKNREAHIITLEDPIELEFDNKKSYINQKELFKDFTSYESALSDLVREAPDIILIGEIRNKEVLKKALEISNSGHLVLGTIHGNNTSSVIGKIIRSSDNEKEIANELSDNLIGILHQEAIYHEGKFILNIETLYNNSKVKAGLLNGKYSGLKSIVQTSGSDGMITLEQYLEKYLYEKGIIDGKSFQNLYEKYNYLGLN